MSLVGRGKPRFKEDATLDGYSTIMPCFLGCPLCGRDAWQCPDHVAVNGYGPSEQPPRGRDLELTR